MENQKELGKTYKNISKRENLLLSEIKKSGSVVFGVDEAQRITGLPKREVYNTLYSLKEKEFLLRVKRDSYILKSEVEGREFEIATNLVVPSYISFWSALSFYGFTEQQLNTIQLVSTKQEKELEFKNHRVSTTTFIPKRFYGYQKINDFSIATKEKALVDSLSDFKKVGGLREFSKCLKNGWEELSQERFIQYLLRFENKSMNSRAGYLIEELELELEEKLREKLLERASKGYVKLDPSEEKGEVYNKKWNLNLNSELR